MAAILLMTFAQAPLAFAQVTSTGAQRTSVAVTVYNDGRGLVREERHLDLAGGVNEVRFMDVAEQIQAPTVRVAPVEGAAFNVLEQNYEYDLLSPAKLLDKFVGQKITLVQQKMSGGSTVEENVEGTLLSNNAGTVWNIGGKIVINPPYSRLVFPSVPDNLIAKPTLVWRIDAPNAGRRRIETSYITGGMKWNADYVLSLDANEEKAGLQGWVTVNNTSGATYTDARLKLVAGDVHRAQPVPQSRVPRPAVAMEMASARTGFVEEGLFEYHLYTLERPATIKNAQTKQIQLLQAEGIPITKDYILNGGQHYFQSVWSGPPSKEKVQVFVRFRNSDRVQGLGVPVPKGIVRVFKKDRSGSPQLIGEDNVDHTPRNEEIRLELGNAFDIAAERRQTDFKHLTSPRTTYESAHEIKIRNQKDTPISVRVVEPIGGEWTMIETSHPNTRTAAFESQWEIPVPANGETVLTYRVRVRY